jgi:hypothetical protein
VIKADILLLCDEVILDSDTKKQSLIGIFDRVDAEKVPTLLPKMCVFVRLKGSAGHHTAYLELIAPPESGLPVNEVTCPFDLKNDSATHNIKATFVPLPLLVYGRYTIRVLDENKSQLNETFLDVVEKR